MLAFVSVPVVAFAVEIGVPLCVQHARAILIVHVSCLNVDIKAQAAYLALINLAGIRLDLITAEILDDLKAKAKVFGVQATSFIMAGGGSHVNPMQYSHAYEVGTERRIIVRGLEAVGVLYMIGVDSNTARTVAELQTIYQRRLSSLHQ